MEQNTKKRHSKTVLKKTLLALMKHKSFSKITIKELCHNANLNRSTFYANYEDILTLLKDVHTDMFHEMANFLARDTSVFSDNKDSAKHWMQQSFKERVETVTAIIYYVKHNKDIFSMLMNNNSDNLFEKHLTDYYMHLYCMENSEFAEKYTFLYHTIGSFSLIHQWIGDNCPSSPEELATLICTQSQNAWFPKV